MSWKSPLLLSWFQPFWPSQCQSFLFTNITTFIQIFNSTSNGIASFFNQSLLRLWLTQSCIVYLLHRVTCKRHSIVSVIVLCTKKWYQNNYSWTLSFVNIIKTSKATKTLNNQCIFAYRSTLAFNLHEIRFLSFSFHTQTQYYIYSLCHVKTINTII